MAERAATALGHGQEVLGFEGVKKGLHMVNNAKSNVDTSRNQTRSFTAGGMPPSQIKPKYNYGSLFKGQ